MRKFAKMQEQVYFLLKDGEWHTTMEVIAYGVASGLRRLRELRTDHGLRIDGKKMPGSAQWQYRMVV